jgi:hypothetical protein
MTELRNEQGEVVWVGRRAIDEWWDEQRRLQEAWAQREP